MEILQNGRGRCKVMLECARKIWWLAWKNNITFRVSHIAGDQNIIADELSRAHLSRQHKDNLQELSLVHNAKIREANDKHLPLQDLINSYEQPHNVA